MYASGCVISGDSIFEGTLRGVTGSFKSLNCVNESGTITGAIRFGSDGNLWLEGDLFANGTKDNRSYRFYTADIWCRGHFASRQRLTLVVCGSYGYYFPKGLPSTWDVSNAVYVSFSSVTSGGQTYYRIPCYSPDGYSALAGMPVDTVLFRITLNTTYRYYFGLAVSQRIVVANINDEQNNVIICCNGRDITWNGGEINFVQNMGYINMKINFDSIKVYTDLGKTQSVTQNMRKEFANFIYTQGNGIAAHALALKIYNGTPDTDYDENEVAIIRQFVDNCTPCVIDAFHEMLNS